MRVRIRGVWFGHTTHIIIISCSFVVSGHIRLYLSNMQPRCCSRAGNAAWFSASPVAYRSSETLRLCVCFDCKQVRAAPAGEGLQVFIAKQISDGATSFLVTEYKYLTGFVVVMAIFLAGVLEGAVRAAAALSHSSHSQMFRDALMSKSCDAFVASRESCNATHPVSNPLHRLRPGTWSSSPRVSSCLPLAAGR